MSNKPETVLGILVDPIVVSRIINEFNNRYSRLIGQHPRPYMIVGMDELRYIVATIACETAVSMYNLRPDEPIDIRTIYIENGFWDEINDHTRYMLEDSLEVEDGSIKPMDEVDISWQEETTQMVIDFAQRLTIFIIKDVARQLEGFKHDMNLKDLYIINIEFTKDMIICIQLIPDTVEETP